MSTEQAGLFLLVFLGALVVGFLASLTLSAWYFTRGSDDEIGYQSKEIRDNARKE